jgi:integrase/recombinase XerD
MLANIGADRPGRKPDKINGIISDRLFFSEQGSEDLKQSLYHLIRSIKKTCPNIRLGKIIRTVMIAEWLKTRDVRIVQDMSGHKWVSSTEKYNAYNLDELKESLKKHYPLK